MAEVVTKVAGVEYILGDLGYVGDLRWSTGWPYGCLEASWTFLLPDYTSPRAVAANAQVEIWDGPVRVWTGFLSEPTPGNRGEPWQLNAKGWYAAFANLLALTSTPAPTAIPQTALTQAISRASLPIVVGTSLPTTTFSSGDETVRLNYLLPFLDAYAESVGKRWRIDQNYVFTMEVDPTDIYYILDSDVVLRGTADDDYVTHVYPRFVSALTDGEPSAWGLGAVSSATTPAGRRERGMDVTNLGLMITGTANALAQGQLNLNSARMGYTSALEVTAGDLVRPGGTAPRLGQVRAGRVIEGFAVADASGVVQLGRTQNVVIGRTDYTDGSDVLTLTPVGLAPRTFKDTLSALKPRDDFDGTAA